MDETSTCRCCDPIAPGLQNLEADVAVPSERNLSDLPAATINRWPDHFQGGAANIFAESHGDGARLLVDSPRVQTVSFTGSTVVGREIAKSAGAALKRVGLELGGKTPHLVFADADLDLAIATIVRSLTTFAGQFCMTGSRVLAESSIADQVRTRLADALSSVRLGSSGSRLASRAASRFR